jgi:hypothetical protein
VVAELSVKRREDIKTRREVVAERSRSESMLIDEIRCLLMCGMSTASAILDPISGNIMLL